MPGRHTSHALRMFGFGRSEMLHRKVETVPDRLSVKILLDIDRVLSANQKELIGEGA